MFAVIFEVQPRTDQQDAYLSIAKMLRPELERIDGFVDNIRYRSLTRDGWLLSLSTWRDEDAVIRWRAHTRHHEAQQKGRSHIFSTYRLRVGEVAGSGTVTLVEAPQSSIAQWLGLMTNASGLMAWDRFDAILTPGDGVLLLSWRDTADAEAFERALSLSAGARLRHVRVVRDYGMFDRGEAPQHFPAAPTS